MEIAHASLFAERQDVFGATARHPRLQQTRSALGKNDLFVRRDVIAVCVRDKGEALRLPGIEPQVVDREIHSVVVAYFDHRTNLNAKRATAIGPMSHTRPVLTRRS